MRGRNRGWPQAVPRPKMASLPSEDLQRLLARSALFVENSVVLRELIENVQLSRGRLYFWRKPEDLMARITPLGTRSMLLETPRRNSWVEHHRGQLTSALKFVEGDCEGTFHGLGSLVAKPRGGHRSAQVVLHQDFKIPVTILAKPRYWYSMHRRPTITEISEGNDRVLVRFVADGVSGTFHGTCLYALRYGEWDCYTIKPSASSTITSAETWLNKRDWEDWG